FTSCDKYRSHCFADGQNTVLRFDSTALRIGYGDTPIQ
ncbi:hypothetical protein VCHENC02_2304B, partial [Vibrio harveyi]